MKSKFKRNRSVPRRYWLTPLVSVLCLLISPSLSYPGAIKGFPDIIVCTQADGGKVVLRIMQTFADGSAAYRGRGNNVGIVGADGVLRRKNHPDCNGKTLKQLRDEGKAFDLVK